MIFVILISYFVKSKSYLYELTNIIFLKFNQLKLITSLHCDRSFGLLSIFKHSLSSFKFSFDYENFCSNFGHNSLHIILIQSIDNFPILISALEVFFSDNFSDYNFFEVILRILINNFHSNLRQNPFQPFFLFLLFVLGKLSMQILHLFLWELF